MPFVSFNLLLLLQVADGFLCAGGALNSAVADDEASACVGGQPGENVGVKLGSTGASFARCEVVGVSCVTPFLEESDFAI